MKTVRVILLIFISVLLIIQFFPTLKNKSNEVPVTDLMSSREVPSHVATLVQNACYDCHSNNTDYPWYNRVQPVAWVLERHIKKAKMKLNFNEFEKYSRLKQKEALEKMHSAVEEKAMPLKSYRILHSEGRLTKSERKQILDWVEEELKDY